MVKPPKTMQPEAINLEKAGRSTNATFGEDSFRNYMARKINMQRQQFGLILPPPPPESEELKKSSKRRVSFYEDVKDKKEKKRKKSGIQSVLKKLQRRHGRRKRKRADIAEEEQHDNTFLEDDVEEFVDETAVKSPASDEIESSDCETQANKLDTEVRKDLFFRGIVVMVNGYTDPDAESIQRMLHKHGGDLEKYETSRITHIIAERLSTAKANIYKKQRKPTPVCYPSWIVDCVKAQSLLPYGPYLIKEVREQFATKESIADLFRTANEKVVSRDGPSVEKGEFDASSLSSSSNAVKKGDLFVDETSQCHSCTVSPINESLESPQQESSEYRGEVSSQSQDTYTLIKSLDSADSPVDEIDRVDDSLLNMTDNVTDFRVDQQIEDVVRAIDEGVANEDSHEIVSGTLTSPSKKDSKYINGRIRTVGTDPDFLESFFSASRLSFIGSFKQRVRNISTLLNEKKVNQQRYVFHIDIDCFFAAVALRNYPAYQDKPVVISHFGVSPGSDEPVDEVTATSTSECATCNYHARKFGIKKGMYLGQAKQLCPDLVVLKYDFEGYEEVSQQVTNILEEQAVLYCGNLEQVSCDEAFLEIFLDVSDESRQKVAVIAETIRTTIFDVTSCTVTVGVGHNKFLAKLATDKVKPNRSFVVDDSHDLLKDLKLRDLHGIGYKLERKLEEEQLVTVQDVWDLGKEGESELIRVLGSGTGRKIWLFCKGIDDRPVQPVERKTIGAECNYGVRFNGPYGVDHMMKGLAKEVARRMAHVGVKGSKVSLKLKQRQQGAPPPPKFLGHGSCHNLSRCCEVPFDAATRDSEVLFQCGMKLFNEMCVNRDDIRGMGIIVSKLVRDNIEEMDLRTRSEPSILDYFKNPHVDAQPNDLSTGEGGADNLITSSTSSEDISVVKVHHPTTEADCDIDIPSLSQLHLSQVNQLPSPMKQTILSKLDTANQERRMTHKNNDTSAREARLLQTDMRRMMKLAAVKSGDQSILGSSDLGVSMSQLESLPLELQLQIANDDNRPIGILSRRSRYASDLSSGKPVRSRIENPASDLSNPHGTRLQEESAIDSDAEVIVVDADMDDQAASLEMLTKQSFYQENVKPLMIFMDENSSDNEEAVNQVLEFFHVVVAEEERHQEAVMLLRSIKRRKDTWNGYPYNRILDELNSSVQRTFGYSLDCQMLE